jgi:streptogramin lyase/cytochrome c5
MGTWTISRSFGYRFTMMVIALLSLAAAYSGHLVSVRAAAAKAVGSAASVPGTASLSGTVDAPKPFKAARVFIRNVDKRILYMVYTNAGVFRAVALFPGNYEINTQAKGLESVVQKLVLKDGDHPTLKLSMRESADPEQLPSSVEDKPATTVQSYDEVYPPGPGREVLEQVCMTCHGENFLPTRPASAAEWRGRLDYMMGKNLFDRDKIGTGEGALAPAASEYRFGLQDRKDALAYMIKNFGPDSKKRTVRTDPEIPLDEAKLGKAEFIEYYLTPDEPAQGKSLADVNSAQMAESGSTLRTKRIGFTVQLDAGGNAWLTDRGFPNRLVKLDPRSGVRTDFLMPDPMGGVHDLVVDREGKIWLFNNTPADMTKEPMLNEFDIETKKWRQMDPDPDNVMRTSVKHGGIGTTIDSKDNVYSVWSMTGVLVKYDRESGKFSTWRIPTNNTNPYGLTIDKNDNLWSANWTAGKLIKFDTTTKEFSEFTPPTYPANLRRGPSVDSKNNVWFGIYSAGNREGKIAELDQTTGRITEWTIPHRASTPYEVTLDREDNIWFPEEGIKDRPGVIARFNPRDKTFTFYPKPQLIADTANLKHTADGAVWYVPRGTISPGFGVLYPDMDAIKTLAAYPLNGPPGVAFKMAPLPQHRKEVAAGR